MEGRAIIVTWIPRPPLIALNVPPILAVVLFPMTLVLLRRDGTLVVLDTMGRKRIVRSTVKTRNTPPTALFFHKELNTTPTRKQRTGMKMINVVVAHTDVPPPLIGRSFMNPLSRVPTTKAHGALPQAAERTYIGVRVQEMAPLLPDMKLLL